MYYKTLLFFAYLRPIKSLSANTRLFFGVYHEIESEKLKTGYKLKVARIAFLPTGENSVHTGKDMGGLMTDSG